MALESTSILTSPHSNITCQIRQSLFFLPATSLGIPSHLPFLLLTQPLFYFSGSFLPTFCTFFLSLRPFICCLWPKSPSPCTIVQSHLSITEMCPPHCGLYLLSWSHPSGIEGGGPRQGWCLGPWERSYQGWEGGAKSRHSAVSFAALSPRWRSSFFLLATHPSSSLALSQAKFL